MMDAYRYRNSLRNEGARSLLKGILGTGKKVSEINYHILKLDL
jgi:hypothetical protein